MSPVALKGIGFYAPEKILTNADFEKIVDTTDEWITTRTGIKSRHIAHPTQATSDLALEASREALKQANIDPKDLELIVVGTSSSDMLFPSVACLLAEKLGAATPMAFDVAAGCSGFLYSLSVAEQFLKSGMYKNALVLGADIITRFADYSDRATCVLFGDGAGAFVLTNEEQGEEFILDLISGCDPYGTDKLLLPAGGSKLPASHDTVEQRLHFIEMNGKEVFRFAVKISETLIKELLERNHIEIEDIDWFAFHQANIRIIEGAADRLKLSKEKVMISLDEYGNTSSATVPMTIYEYWRKGRLKKGDLMVMIVFGAGLTYSIALVRWPL